MATLAGPIIEINEVTMARLQGLVRKICNEAYRDMPECHRRWIDVGDLTSEAWIKVYRKWHLYDPARAKDSTFVYTVVQNTMRDRLKQLRVYTRFTHIVSIEDESCKELEREAPGTAEQAEAEIRVNRFLELASPSLRDFIQLYFFQRQRGRPDYSPFLPEVRRLRRVTGCSTDDFMLCASGEVNAERV
jgi:RNA polymerase sigma factor (sigma-70 family)